jgi:hypothetical protein
MWQLIAGHYVITNFKYIHNIEVKIFNMGLSD